jgi:Ion channel
VGIKMKLPTSEGIFRLSGAQLLIALTILLVALPFLDETPNGALVEGILMTVVLLSAVAAVGGRRASFIAALVLVIPAVVTKWFDQFRPGLLPSEIHLLAAMVFLIYIIAHLLRFILRTPHVTGEVLCSAAATYLLLAMLWAFAYTILARINPDAFAFNVKADPHPAMARFQALYFSFCTLTTVGYGDIAPVSNVARVLAMAESTTGIFFATILIARLVALYSSNRSDPPT